MKILIQILVKCNNIFVIIDKKKYIPIYIFLTNLKICVRYMRMYSTLENTSRYLYIV